MSVRTGKRTGRVMMTLDEVIQVMQSPEYANRVAVLVKQEGDDYVAQWDGREVRAGNPFGLDGKLNYTGAPSPRNLCLVSAEDYEHGPVYPTIAAPLGLAVGDE